MLKRKKEVYLLDPTLTTHQFSGLVTHWDNPYLINYPSITGTLVQLLFVLFTSETKTVMPLDRLVSLVSLCQKNQKTL